MQMYVHFKTRHEFRAWLNENAQSKRGVWLCFDKSQKRTTLSAHEALEEALCFGWIDGQMQRLNDQLYIKYFSLRRKNSKWSEKNKALALELTNTGKMRDAGRLKIQEAKQNGQWDMNHTQVIDEVAISMLMQELEGHEPAYTHFMAMSLSVKKTYTKAFLAPKTAKGKQQRLAWILKRLDHNLKPM